MTDAKSIGVAYGVILSLYAVLSLLALFLKEWHNFLGGCVAITLLLVSFRINSRALRTLNLICSLILVGLFLLIDDRYLSSVWMPAGAIFILSLTSANLDSVPRPQ
jgi:hypothetical protein